MSSRYQRRLLDHLHHDSYSPRRVAEVATDLNVPKEDLPDFLQAVKELEAQQRIEVDERGIVQLPSVASHGGTVTGIFRKNARGFGFVQPAQLVREGSIFIAPDDTADALTGDVVRIAVAKERRRGPDGEGYVGRVVEVLERKRSSYAGVMSKRGTQWVMIPDGKRITDPIIIRDADAKHVREGDKVIVELTQYPEGNLLAEGVITRVLGDAGKPDVETQAVIAAYDLPDPHFPEPCVEQAREASAEFDRQVRDFLAKGAAALTNRADLTEDFIITIDPPDAKDYDDAISIRPSDSVPGGWDLGVHIADVAHFIPPDSPLDIESKDRCNSCYLPRLVIPMLPENLSNGICSLQEGVHRFCKSAFMTYDAKGNVRSESVANTLIKSAKRLTYLEAQFLIDGKPDEARKHAKTPPNYTDHLIETLRQMNACAKAIQARRHKQGMIVLDLPEVELVFDDNGHVVDAQQEDDAFTHKLIEMFMVEANEVLARLFEELQVPLLRRIHPEPVPGDVDEMRKTAMVAGFRIPKHPTREELQGLLDATRGSPAARAVHMAVLRTMSKAEYSPALIGHFALASEAYAHFTSPIRRYADLTVHRALAEFLRRTENGRRPPRSEEAKHQLGQDLVRTKACPPEEDLAAIGRHASLRENNAESAERELRSFLVLQLLAKHVGESFDVTVTGVSPRGLFVQLEKYLSDGFIKAEDLPGDVTRENLTPMWRIDQRSGGLVDIRSGRSFNFGDRFKAKIAVVDLTKRTLELVVDDGATRAAGKAKKAFLNKSDATRSDPNANFGSGIGSGGGAGFKAFDGKTGSQRRSQRSKSRDQRKKNHRRDDR